MKKIFFLAVFFLAVLVLIVGCSEDPIPDYGPPLPIIAFKGPQTSSTHTEAENVVGWISEFNGFSTSLSAFSNTEPSTAGNTYTWVVVQNGVSYTLTGTMRPDSGYTWKLVLNGRQDDGVMYNNWTAFDGTTDASRKNAAWQIYIEHTTSKRSDFLWSVSSTVSLTGTLNQYTDGVLTGSTVITDNANSTGQIFIYEQGVLRYKAVWLSNGTGHYEYYNAQGVKESEGDWT